MRPERYLGAVGEGLAAAWLRRAGYRILARNFQAEGTEVDLIACRGEELVVVEVKTRRSAWALPERAVDAAKAERLRRGARAFLARHPLLPVRTLRFDVVAILLRPGGAEVRHFPNAFPAEPVAHGGG